MKQMAKEAATFPAVMIEPIQVEEQTPKPSTLEDQTLKL